MSDMTAIGVMTAAAQAGVRVPVDLSVVGFDDLPIAAWTNPALTTVRQPIVEKGRIAARLLIQRLQGKAGAIAASARDEADRASFHLESEGSEGGDREERLVGRMPRCLGPICQKERGISEWISSQRSDWGAVCSPQSGGI